MLTLASQQSASVIGLLSVVMSLVTWAVLWSARSPSVHLWALGGFVGGSLPALVMWGNPGQVLPASVYFALVGTVVFAGVLCRPSAIGLLLQKRISSWWVATMFGVNLVVAVTFSAAGDAGWKWLSWYLSLATVVAFALATAWAFTLGHQKRLLNATLLGITTGSATLGVLLATGAGIWTNANLFSLGADPVPLSVFALNAITAICNSAFFIGIVLDLLVRRESEAQARFRSLTDAAPVGVFQADSRGNNVFMNPAMERIMGMSADEARGKGWMESIHPEDKERVLGEWMAAIAAGRDFMSEYRFLTPSGRSCWVRGYGSGIRDPAGANAGYMAVVADITEQRALEQRLAVTSRLAALGTLVSGVAHEINNPMTGILAGLGLARQEADDARRRLEGGECPTREALIKRNDEMQEVLGDAAEAAEKIARIVRDLSLFGAPSQERARVKVTDIVAGALRWIPSSDRNVATVGVEDRGAPDVMASRGQLEQVLVNLVTNAARATRPGETGTIMIRVGEGPAGMARLEVVDHGTGISPAHLGRIFDPFFTTRPAGEGRGTGLGLAICHAIVEDHGGTITVESEVGKGSTFTVELPAAPLGA